MLGGRIEVQSQLGEGSVFRFFIQTRTVSPPDTTVPIQAPTPEYPFDSTRTAPTTPPIIPTNSPLPAGISTSKLHILIVEDNIINQTVLKRQIIKAGLTCDVANNGLEALNLIREADRQSRRTGGVGQRKRLYSVVLMDLEMPVMDGLTAIRELREAEEKGVLKRNMVIALTGNARQGQIDQAMAAGMDDGESYPRATPYKRPFTADMRDSGD